MVGLLGIEGGIEVVVEAGVGITAERVRMVGVGGGIIIGGGRRERRREGGGGGGRWTFVRGRWMTVIFFFLLYAGCRVIIRL